MAIAEGRHAVWLTSEAVGRLSEELHDPPSLRALRTEAFDRFRELPIEPDPLYRKYGYFTGVDLTGLDPTSKTAPVPLPPSHGSTVLVVHDGSGTRVALPPELANAGVRLRTWSQLVEEGPEALAQLFGPAQAPTDRLSALRAAVMNRGYHLQLPDDLETAVRVKDLTVLSGNHESLSVRRSVRLGRRARVLMSEEVYSSGPAGGQRFAGSSTDLALGDDAHAAYLTVHAPDENAISVVGRNASVGRNARLGWVWMGLGGFRTKMRNRTELVGTGADVEDLQAFYGCGQQHYDSAVDVTHVATDTHGQSVTRGVFTDQARGMSRGRVRIEKEARRTLSFLSEHAMLLSREARSDTIPILEILCRDVKATHSSSVAPVDPEKVFYLESRGLARTDAIRAIGEGFLSHVLERSAIQGLRETLYPYLAARWDHTPLDWGDGQSLSLAPLEFRGAESSPEWRFDAKLR